MHDRRLAGLFASGVLALSSPISAETAAPSADVDLKLFEKTEVDRSNGCSVVLWQDDRDPETDRYAYLFAETLSGKNHTRQPARIKIGGAVTTMKRVAKGGKTTGYDLFEYQLYQLPAPNEFVVLQLKLAEEEGESVDVESGAMTIIMKGKPLFRATVKGNAGCMTPAAAETARRGSAAPDGPARATASEPPVPDVGPGMFERYTVRSAQLPAKLTGAAKKQFGCDPAMMKTGATAFQLSEESAIWQIPCGEHGASSRSAVYALVYVPDPAANYSFLPLPTPKGVTRALGDHTLMDPKWDLKTRIVTGIHTEGNGSDCGQFERYQVTAEGGFRLIEFRAKDKCDGKSMKPQDFPLVFKAK